MRARHAAEDEARQWLEAAPTAPLRRRRLDAATRPGAHAPVVAVSSRILSSSRVVQDEGSEDLEAGYAGAPFVQPEHEEEWMEWVDWAQVEGQASGSSSNV